MYNLQNKKDFVFAMLANILFVCLVIFTTVHGAYEVYLGGNTHWQIVSQTGSSVGVKITLYRYLKTGYNCAAIQNAGTTGLLNGHGLGIGIDGQVGTETWFQHHSSPIMPNQPYTNPGIGDIGFNFRGQDNQGIGSLGTHYALLGSGPWLDGTVHFGDCLYYPLVVSCTDENSEWVVLHGSVVRSYSVNDRCIMGNLGKSWISGLVGAPDVWSMSYYMPLIYNPTGSLNSPPVALFPPYATFIVGCPGSYEISMFDPDGDAVTCMLADYGIQGGDVDGGYPFFSIHTVGSQCILEYSGAGTAEKVVPIALVITDETSYTSLQFVARVLTGTCCNTRPSLISPTPVNRQIIRINATDTWSFSIATTPGDSGASIQDIGVIGPRGITVDSSTGVGSWTPQAWDVGTNYACMYSINTDGLVSQPNCVVIEVHDGDLSCDIDNGGCSHFCKCGICSCPPHYILGPDGKQCIIEINGDCGNGSITFRIHKDAVVDDLIGVGDYQPPPYVPPDECKPSIVGNYYVFNFSFTECGAVEIVTLNELKYQSSVLAWVDRLSTIGNPLITRGLWVKITYVCSVEKYGSVNGTFDPEDEYITVIKEEGFPEMELFFDFFTDKTFTTPYAPAAYPVKVLLNDDLYFGIRVALLTASTEPIQLYTEKCEAFPVPNPDNIGPYVLFDRPDYDGTVKANYSQPMFNKFSIKAFRFRYGLSGIEEATNVRITCTVVVCFESVSGTTCDDGLNNLYLPHLNRRRREIVGIFYQEKRQGPTETSPHEAKSGRIQIQDSPGSGVSSYVGKWQQMAAVSLGLLFTCTYL